MAPRRYRNVKRRMYNKQPYYKYNRDSVTYPKNKTVGNFIKKYGTGVVFVMMAIGLAMAITSVSVKNYYSVNGQTFGIFRGDGEHKQCLGALLNNKGQPRQGVEKSVLQTCKSNMSMSLISICLALIPVSIGVLYGIYLGIYKGRREFVNSMFNKDALKWAMIVSVVGASITQIISLVLQIATPVNGDLNVSNILELGGGKVGPGFATSITATVCFLIAAFFLIVMVFM